MKTKIYNRICEILEKKERDRQEPKIVMSVPLFHSLGISLKEYGQAINELIREGKIIYGEAFNDIYFKKP